MPITQQPGPRGELDRRYSDPGAEATRWEAAARRLAAAQVAWIVTVRPDGRPHATPMVPVVGPGAAYFHTGTTEVKYANLKANPRVLVLAGDTTWESGLDVRDGAFVNDREGGVASILFEVRPATAYAYARGGPFSQTRFRFPPSTQLRRTT